MVDLKKDPMLKYNRLEQAIETCDTVMAMDPADTYFIGKSFSLFFAHTFMNYFS